MSENQWTYGAEHELADWDRRLGLPRGCEIDENDHTMVNSNGIAVDPKGKLYPFGGELKTRPTDTPDGQLVVLSEFKEMHPAARANYRSNLHIHIRVPGLREDLPRLKRLQEFNARWLPRVLPLVDPIEKPTWSEYPTNEEHAGAMRRWRRRRVSHHTIIPEHRVKEQLQARSLKDFFEREVPWSEKLGKPQWQCQPRAAVNLRQLLQTDTIEFRHFGGTLREEELMTCLRWCEGYLESALGLTVEDPLELWHRLANEPWPEYDLYDHKLETTYRRTVLDGTLKRAEVIKNIANILTPEKA